MRSLCALVFRQDKRFLSELKMTLREGVMLFEEYQDAVVAQGGQRLVETLRRVPTIAEGYYARMAARMRELGATAPGTAQEMHAAEPAAQIPDMEEFPGHGAVIEAGNRPQQ
jgi:hypothetical protein